MQPDFFPTVHEPISDVEAVDLTARAMCAGPVAGVSRTIDLHLASMCAEALADRLHQVGIILVRRTRDT